MYKAQKAMSAINHIKLVIKLNLYYCLLVLRKNDDWEISCEIFIYSFPVGWGQISFILFMCCFSVGRTCLAMVLLMTQGSLSPWSFPYHMRGNFILYYVMRIAEESTLDRKGAWYIGCPCLFQPFPTF